jgi:hypothetical protein
MDPTSLMMSMIFGTFGLGFLMYARKAGRIVPGVVGLILMVCPYFIPNVTIMVIVCTILTAIPFFLRHL